jgi:hypothetical protein
MIGTIRDERIMPPAYGARTSRTTHHKRRPDYRAHAPAWRQEKLAAGA